MNTKWSCNYLSGCDMAICARLTASSCRCVRFNRWRLRHAGSTSRRFADDYNFTFFCFCCLRCCLSPVHITVYTGSVYRALRRSQVCAARRKFVHGPWFVQLPGSPLVITLGRQRVTAAISKHALPIDVCIQCNRANILQRSCMGESAYTSFLHCVSKKRLNFKTV